MALKRIAANTEQVETTRGTDRPRIKITGTSIQSYGCAVLNLKIATEDKNSASLEFIDEGVEHVIKENLKRSDHPIPTIELEDSSGSVVQFQFKNQYGSISAESANILFESIRIGEKKLDVNDFVQEVIVASFDNSIFFNDKGDFVQSRFDAFKKAVTQVVEELKLPNNPLSYEKKVTVKPDFHLQRWSKIPSRAAQQQIQKVLPASVTMKVIELKNPTAQPSEDSIEEQLQDAINMLTKAGLTGAANWIKNNSK